MAGASENDSPRISTSDEYERMRRAYAEQPDSETEADDWSNVEEFAT